MSKYDVTFAIEIAREKSACILSEYERFFELNNISTDDAKNPDVSKYWELVRLSDNLYTAQTVEEVKETEATFETARSHIRKALGYDV